MNKNKHELISDYNPKLKETDPELTRILDNFIENETLKKSTLNDRTRMLVILSTLIANQSTKLYEKILSIALDYGLTPVEIKELLYQSIPYVGLSKAYEFFELTNETFAKRGIELPLPDQSTIKYEDRIQEGYNIQSEHYTKEWIDSRIENTPEGQKHVWDFISGFAFGDFYTRNGLSMKDREIITFSLILSLRGCEDQLRIHVKGNLTVGNTKKTLISAITVLVPYIGFPRVHNALAVVNEICD